MNSNARPKLKTSFKVSNTYEPIHTGGKVALSGDGTWLISTLNEQALITEVSTGKRIKELVGDTSAVTTLCITPSPPSPHSGGYLLTCTRSQSLQIYSLPSLELHKSIPKAHESPIITCVSDPTGTLFATGSADGIIKVWDASKGHCTHVFKGHGGVISALVFYISQIDLNGKGTSKSEAKLISGADDCKIRVWDLKSRECLNILDGHVSVIRGLDVTTDGNILISGGRDKVINIWDLERGVLKKTMPVFETLESVGLILSSSPSTSTSTSSREKSKGKGKEGDNKKWLIFSGGDKGIVRLWDLISGEPVNGTSALVQSTAGKTHEILEVLYTPLKSSLTAVYVDQNIVTRSVPSLSITQQIIGFNDEVIDTVFLSSPSTSTSTSTSISTTPPIDTHLALATNSDLIRIYDLKTFNTSLLEGHQDVVLCLAKSLDGTILISGSKDNTARIWQATTSTISTIKGGEEEEDEIKTSTNWNCIGLAKGHVESIGAIAISKKDNSFLITASQDRTAKIWDLNSLLSSTTSTSTSIKIQEEEESEPNSINSLTTLKIHDKDINSLDISPNDKLLASGSQDRTAKLFSITHSSGNNKLGNNGASASLTLLGTFKGHKKGIWSVKFSSSDQCLATASGDRTVKLWNLSDFSCIKTFEGHSNSVLRVDFINRAMQLISCASDGLVKVWNVKDEECATTLDNHEEKIWALAIGSDEKIIVSGGADSVVTFWEDVTATEELERIAAHEQNVLKEQDFENYLSINDYSNAILLALSLDQPRRLLNLFIQVRLSLSDSTSTSLNSITGSLEVDKVIQSLKGNDLRKLLEYIKDWNTVGRTSEIAQGVLNTILKFHSAEFILKTLEDLPKPLIELESEDEDDDEQEKERKILASKKIKKVLKAGEILAALIPYTERHFSRADKMVRESFIVDHLLGMMDDGIMEMEVDA